MILPIQIATKGLTWSETPKQLLTFKDWEDAVTFAYRLALALKTQIRIEQHGNGNYFPHENAANYLTKKNITNKF